MSRLSRLTFFLCFALLVCPRGLAQQSGDTSSGIVDSITNLLAAGYFEEQQTSISNRTDLSDDVLAAAIELYNGSIALRGEVEDLQQERDRFVKTREGASNQLFQANQALAVPAQAADLDVDADSSSQALEQRISELQAELQLAEAERARLEDEPKRRADRKIKIAELIAEYRSAYNDLDRPEAVQEEQTVPEEFSEAVQDYIQLHKAVYLYRIRNLNLELASFDATADLVLARQALASRRAETLAEQVTQLKARAAERRQQESADAAQQAEEARQRAEALALPVVTSLAEANHQLAQTRVELAGKLRAATARLDDLEADTKAIRASFDSVREQVETVQKIGLPQNRAIGMALRQEQYSLPSRERQEKEIRDRREEMASAQLEWLRISKERRSQADPEKRLAAIRESLPADMPAWQRQEAIEKCRELLDQQRSLLADVAADYGSLGEVLKRLTLAQQTYLETIDEFREYISERVLWIQSTERLSAKEIKQEVGTIWRVLNIEIRDGLIPYFKRDFVTHPYTYLSVFLILLALLAVRPLLARGLAGTCPAQQPADRLSLRPAVLALVYTLIFTIPVPLSLVFLGVRLQGHTGETEMAEQWASSLQVVGFALLVLEFIRQACRRPGLALAHLRWPEHNVRLTRFHFTWFLSIGVPLGILTDALEGVFVEGVSNRLLFICGQFLIILFGHLLLRVNGGLRFSSHVGEMTTEGPLKLQRFYHFLAMLIPTVLTVMSAMGYTYTARSIWLRVGDSIQWGLVVLVVTMLILHWLTVLRRRLAVKKALLRKSLEDDKEAQEQAGPDIWQVYAASRRLFSALLWIVMLVGLWVIWSDMLPALKRLDRTPLPLLSRAVHFEPHVPTISPTGMPSGGSGEEQATDSGETRAAPFERTDFVSVADALQAVIVILLTIAASRNLPGFVNMVLLSRVRFRQGEGYAIVTVLRYTVLLLGLGWAVTLLGITWNKVQWLAAAITVGIGFGLQEIFANFVSGLILLFERPVRVGDVITAGEVTGTVTRIQMRATTIRNWDQQEMVIPNKDLITGQVINWTLSNDVSRLAIVVGVSYDADVKRASELLLKIARENANVCDDPAPFVTFEEFGDSTLNLVLRAYVSIEVRLGTKNQINNAILDSFREAGIEIAYPQRDLHLRSIDSQLSPLRVTGDSNASSES